MILLTNVVTYLAPPATTIESFRTAQVGLHLGLARLKMAIKFKVLESNKKFFIAEPFETFLPPMMKTNRFRNARAHCSDRKSGICATPIEEFSTFPELLTIRRLTEFTSFEFLSQGPKK